MSGRKREKIYNQVKDEATRRSMEQRRWIPIKGHAVRSSDGYSYEVFYTDTAYRKKDSSSSEWLREYKVVRVSYKRNAQQDDSLNAYTRVEKPYYYRESKPGR